MLKLITKFYIPNMLESICKNYCLSIDLFFQLHLKLVLMDVLIYEKLLAKNMEICWVPTSMMGIIMWLVACQFLTSNI
jgi:hypothetical protein